MTRYRQNLALLLCALTLLLLASGCGKTPVPEATPSPTPAPTPTACPEYLWTTEFTKIEERLYTLRPLAYTGNGFYACGEEKTGEDIPEEVIKKAQKEKKEVVNDGRYDVYALRLCFVGMDGTVTDLEKYSQMSLPKNTAGWKDYDALTNLTGLALDEEGKLYTLEYTYECGNTAPENEEDREEGENYSKFSTKWYLRQLNEEGKERSRNRISPPEGMTFTGTALLYRDGNFHVLYLQDGVSGIAVISPDGKVLSSTAAEGDAKKLLFLSDGSVGLCTTTEDLMKLYRFDSEANTLTHVMTLPEGAEQISSGSGDSLCYCTRDVHFLSCSDEGTEELFNWTAVNVNKTGIASEVAVEDGQRCVFMTNDGNIATLTRIPYDASYERKALTLSTVNPTNDLIDAVAEFNRTHYEVRIDIEDYSTYTGGSTGEAALKSYVYNHLGGKMPDIIDIGTLPYATMAAEGLFEDLYPYLDSDVQLSRSDFFQNILVALEVEGKLCCTCAGFRIDTVLGESVVVGDRSGWSYERYYNALRSMGEDCEGFDSYTTRDEILKDVLALDLDQFIDWDNFTCNFTDGNFDDLVDFVNTFPSYVDYGSYSTGEMESTDMRIRNGRQMLLRQTLYGFDDAMRAGYEFEGDVTFIGYPTNFGTGSSMTVLSTADGGNFAMSAQCADKEAAWEFLRTFFTDEYQTKKDFFPTNVNVFNRKLDAAMQTQPVLSAKGEQLYDDEGQPRIYAVGTMYLSDYTAVPYYPLTSAQAERLKNLVNTTEKIANYNEDLYRIVRNALDTENPAETVQREAEAYLALLKETKETS